ncbi:hypothetical protein SCNU_11785 [Gordonia neofelifaecis NRRL B-59395]|uniref:Uncharacterized protein n=1 Tax=Gordonia neofelifaecis NRRL B-59395 TaxID=644548 RepID=F1YK40_9ACTN|nr:hypothetical protein SCNU_11785 [Gordonia neofelifaecis NRRL B-59395]
MITMVMMGAASFLIGVVRTYAAIGAGFAPLAATSLVTAAGR